jgi:hypothetical protein
MKHAARLGLFFCLAYSETLKKEETRSSESRLTFNGLQSATNQDITVQKIIVANIMKMRNAYKIRAGKFEDRKLQYLHNGRIILK